MKLDSYLTPYAKATPDEYKAFNYESKTSNSLVEHIG